MQSRQLKLLERLRMQKLQVLVHSQERAKFLKKNYLENLETL